MTGELPAELFRNLPEWCVYIEARCGVRKLWPVRFRKFWPVPITT